jgi:hypothetical protein
MYTGATIQHVATSASFDCHVDGNTYVRSPGVDLSPPEIANMTGENWRTVGERYIDSRYGNRQISYTMTMKRGAASALIADMATLISACSEPHNFIWQPSGAAGTITFRAQPFVPEADMSDDSWRETSCLDINMTFTCQPFGLGPTAALATAASSVASPAQVNVTGQSMDVPSPARLIVQHNSSAYNRWIVGRRLNYSSAFVGVKDSGDWVAGSGAAEASALGGSYWSVSVAAGAGAQLEGISQDVTVCKGTYRVFARLAAPATAAATYRAYVTCGSVSTPGVVANPNLNSYWQIVDLGAITIPPAQAPDNATGGVLVSINGYNNGASAAPLDIDWMAMVPTDGGCCYYEGTSYSTVAGIGIDGISETKAVYTTYNTPAFGTVRATIPARNTLWELGPNNNIVYMPWLTGSAVVNWPATGVTVQYSTAPRYFYAR